MTRMSLYKLWQIIQLHAEGWLSLTVYPCLLRSFSELFHARWFSSKPFYVGKHKFCWNWKFPQTHLMVVVVWVVCLFVLWEVKRSMNKFQFFFLILNLLQFQELFLNAWGKWKTVLQKVFLILANYIISQSKWTLYFFDNYHSLKTCWKFSL